MHRSLTCGDIDLVIGLLPVEEQRGLASEAFIQTPYSIVGRANHPLIGKSSVTIDDLLEYVWVVGTEGSNRRACFQELFADRTPPRTPICTCALPGLHHLLAGGDRLTLMTAYELSHERGDLATIPFRPIALVPAIGVTMRADWLPTKTHRALIDIVRRKTIDTARKLMQPVEW